VIAVLPKSFRDNHILMAELQQAFPHEDLTDSLADSHAAIVGLNTIGETTLALYPALRFISKYGVGMDNIDLDACKRRWVRVLWTPGVNAAYVAEYTLGLILSLIRKIHEPIWHDPTGDWVKPKGQSLFNKSIGIIGYGHVGKLVGQCFSNQSTIFWNDINGGATKEEIYSQCDIITLHVPLTPETKHLINSKTLAMMKPSAYLINTSRGAVVDQEALKYALKNKIIAGAALDVFEHEPCNDEELLNMENVICTPHIAGNSEQAILAMGRAAIENLKKMVEP
jgi:D-3-phosphoglycerate dehydrogenase